MRLLLIVVCVACATVGALLIVVGVVHAFTGVGGDLDYLALSLLPFAIAALVGAGASRLGEQR